MSADKTLIDTMTRALWLEDAKRIGKTAKDPYWPDPSWYDAKAADPISGREFIAQWEGQARAAIRSLLEAGPTEAMLKAVEWRGEYAPSADDYRAMLRAALEEADNHG